MGKACLLPLASAAPLNAIIPSWDKLSLCIKEAIPRSTQLQISIAGSQGWAYPEGLYQIEVAPCAVLGQASKTVPSKLK